MSKIEIKNIFKIFGDKPQRVMTTLGKEESKEDFLSRTGHTVGLRDVSMQINEGEVFVVMGFSGSGKSTLIRHLNRLIEPTSGEVIVDGVNVLKMNDAELREFRRHKISMVFQRFGLFPHKNIMDNVTYGLAVQGMKRDARDIVGKKWIDAVGLSGYEKSYPDELSGGMQQRVGLARALATDPEILLMDEAFSALDPLIRRDMQNQLLELQKELNKTIVFITHDLDEALRIGDRIAILNGGKLVQVGTPEDILLRPADDYVENFVKDVNRSRVLTARSVIEKVATIQMNSKAMDKAFHTIQESDEDYAYVLDNRRHYEGIITLDNAEKAMNSHSININNKITRIPEIHEDMSIEEILPISMTSKYPLPVVDSDGKFLGAIPRRKLAESITIPEENDAQVDLAPDSNDIYYQ